MTTGGQDIRGGMRRQDECNATISGLWEGPGSLDISRGAQHANKQKPHARNKDSTLQNHCARERTPFHTDSDGSDHWTPKVVRIRRHTNNS